MRCTSAAVQVLQDYEKTPEQVDFRDPTYLKKATDRMPDLGRKVWPSKQGDCCASGCSGHGVLCLHRPAQAHQSDSAFTDIGHLASMRQVDTGAERYRERDGLLWGMPRRVGHCCRLLQPQVADE